MLGAIVGDVVGSRYEFHNIKTKEFPLFDERCRFTDDTVMTIAVADICNSKDFSKENIIHTMKRWGKRYPRAGYGGMFYNWVLGSYSKPYNSFGNGSAMRVSPVAWVAKSEEECAELSRKVTEVTHNHPEGIKGAETIAVLCYKALHGASKEEMYNYAVSMYPIIKSLDYSELVKTYEHAEETCQESCPQALFCFFISDSFEDCLRTTISIGGDCDTTAAMSMAIAKAYYKEIPELISKSTETYLTRDILDVISIFEEKYKCNK